MSNTATANDLEYFQGHFGYSLSQNKGTFPILLILPYTLSLECSCKSLAQKFY